MWCRFHSRALPWDTGPASDCFFPVVLQEISKRRLQVFQLASTLIHTVIKLLLEEQTHLTIIIQSYRIHALFCLEQERVPSVAGNTGSDLISIRAGSSEAVKLLKDVVLLLNIDDRAEVRKDKVYF